MFIGGKNLLIFALGLVLLLLLNKVIICLNRGPITLVGKTQNNNYEKRTF